MYAVYIDNATLIYCTRRSFSLFKFLLVFSRYYYYYIITYAATTLNRDFTVRDRLHTMYTCYRGTG
jgi:hypothetical protein